ncbi:sodium ion-translocating decarboxylase beta subunit [Elusimicrobium posterum]
MEFLDSLTNLWYSTGIYALTWQQGVMILVCMVLLYLGIGKQFEPLLLVPIAFGGILANIPLANIAQSPELVTTGVTLGNVLSSGNFLGIIYDLGIESGLFPLLIFIGVGSMTDFGPLIANPKTAILGGAAQFGIFTTLIGALLLAKTGYFNFSIQDAAAIGIIGGADGPTSIFLARKLSPNLLGAIAVAAYSYMALVPVIQPPSCAFLQRIKKEKLK